MTPEEFLTMLDEDEQQAKSWEQEIKQLDDLISRHISDGDIPEAEKWLAIAAERFGHGVMTPSFLRQIDRMVDRHRWKIDFLQRVFDARRDRIDRAAGG